MLEALKRLCYILTGVYPESWIDFQPGTGDMEGVYFTLGYDGIDERLVYEKFPLIIIDDLGETAESLQGMTSAARYDQQKKIYRFRIELLVEIVKRNSSLIGRGDELGILELNANLDKVLLINERLSIGGDYYTDGITYPVNIVASQAEDESGIIYIRRRTIDFEYHKISLRKDLL